MDDIVKQAMAKWPDVPHCYGWLGLDARGNWRMRDEQTQHLGQLGDKIAHVALLAFINRNYSHDDEGRWYFQNGPQRVYVDLEATPYIARTDPAHGLMLQTTDALTSVDHVWMAETGQLLLESEQRIAQVDDRDMAQCMRWLTIDGTPVNDNQLIAWIEGSPESGGMMFEYAGARVPVQHLQQSQIAEHFGFVRKPTKD